LIQVIQEDLLKSAELTGLWEKKLRQVERGEYAAKDFLDELKAMVTQIVFNVKSDNRRVGEASLQKPTLPAKATEDNLIGTTCPICGKGKLIKGNAAYGCSDWKNGCGYPLQF
jgi:DNA topoisomerase-3